MKERYQIFARKYRPQTFNEVVGQKTIITTLKNSIKFNKTSQAYLFSGAKGTGKTSIMRILAKALICNNLKNSEPCNECSLCLEIINSSSLDVIEIDGASNRGIDDIRQINETIGYAPSNGKYKIYIIDEVHMLTKEAFNALLKTLEEPPSTVKFFFATTEPHKVLPTIISRCQRFDLNRIPIDLIVEKITKITEDQKRNVSKETLNIIAHYAEGSLRDAESMLDQLLCYTDGDIKEETANEIFGLIPQDLFFELDKAIHSQNISYVFSLTDELYKTGKDFSFFLEELIEHFRKMFLIKLNKHLLFISEHILSKYKENASKYSSEQIITILEMLIYSLEKLKKHISKKNFLETILFKIIKSKNKIPIEVLIKRLQTLEKSINKEKSIYQEIPFNIDISQKASEENNNIPKDYDKTSKDSKNVDYDTLLNFTAVEFNSILKKE
ncbi:MAG: hypothetical protein AMS24_02485 [Chlamydiae bacterium SM23_39]|nr:MAG: hypothetical protein AMS24_02485 [Chlamydiae bacterium SM23_39]